MFKNHPKGLMAAALANMGERFGFYTMMAILVLFLQAKFGLSGTNAGIIYSIFYFSIYILAFVGGLIADKTRNYKGTILTGLILMAVGYFLIAIPSPTPSPNKVLFLTLTCIGLLVIAIGNGLFKGNLQALVGQMYDNPAYGKMRDSGFSLFYMFINVGAIFAPLAAIGVRNWWLGSHGYQYNADLPALCHAHLEGSINAGASESLVKMSTAVSGTPVTDMTAFAKDYLNVFSTGFHYAFGVAIFAMAISLIIYLVNKKNFPNPKKVVTSGTAIDPDAILMDIKEVKQRMYALFAVFGVAIFFWMSFHQNGLTLTFFAKEYTDLSIMKVSLGSITLKGAEIFQSINPFFVVFLTPLVLAFFGWLRKNGKEPSTPKKIAIGMCIAAIGFLIMAIGSYIHHLPLHAAIDPKQGGIPLDESLKVTPFLLIGTYFVLTVAELFISPLGISFVSKVAPPQYQGIMQGGWLGATAIGNSMLFVGAVLYDSVPIWMTWMLFVTACTISMLTMIFMLKWLERVAK
ncbi:MAG: peptide MFS transporter [Bacteroidota bacterium]